MQNPAAIISLEIGAALLYWLVFVVIETAVLQFFKWANFQHCLRASLLANLASGLFVAFSLIWIPRFGMAGLITGLMIAIGLEGFALTLLNPKAKRLGWIAAAIANLVSFLILVFPVFWFTR
jgi:hypothetical protein